MCVCVFFYRHYRGGSLINVFLRLYFALFCIIVFIYFVLFIFSGVFISIIRGTPDKRITEGQKNICFVFIGIKGGTPDKRISEALFCHFVNFVFIFFV